MSAQIAYFKGLMHAADACSCAESENWIRAAVSLYYAAFDLSVAALLASEYDRTVRPRGQGNWLPLDDAIAQGEDPYGCITHEQALRFARREMGQEYANALDRLREHREYASYCPRIEFREGGPPLVNVCAFDAPRFIHTVQQEIDQVERIFQVFRDHLYEQRYTHLAADLGQSANYRWVLALMECESEDPIREFGRYRSERTRTLARQLDFAVFPEQASAD